MAFCAVPALAPPSLVPRWDSGSQWATCPNQGHMVQNRPLIPTEDFSLTLPPAFHWDPKPNTLFSVFLLPLCSLILGLLTWLLCPPPTPSVAVP